MRTVVVETVRKKIERMLVSYKHVLQESLHFKIPRMTDGARIQDNDLHGNTIQLYFSAP